MAGGIAHDFNNFLGAIIVNAQLARAACAADATVAERLDCVIAASRQAAGLARQILTFSRRGEQQRRPVQLGPVVQEALRLLQATLPVHVEVQVDIPSAGRTVLADATQVQEAVINLWMNACHACREAGGRVVVSLADRDVDGSGQHPGLPAGPYVCLTVRDNGCGMSPEVQERIFEPFFSTKTEGQGTGLGLALVQRIMLAHQGAIAVESRAQEGTAFHLLFPEHPQEAAATGLSEPLPRRNGDRRPVGGCPWRSARDAVQGLVESLGSRDTACGPPWRPRPLCAHPRRA